MALDPELHALLQIIRDGREIEELVHWKVPYERILRHLRALLHDKLIEYQGFKLALTQTGHEALADPPAVRPPRPATALDPLRDARTAKASLGSVHLPGSVIK